LQGPLAHAIMRRFTGLDPRGIRYYSFTETVVDGRRVVIGKMSFTGSGGFEFHVANNDARWLWKTLMEIGGEAGMLPMGQCALESLRQEGGYLLVGNDHDKTRNPLEAGIGQTVKFSKADFNGRRALLKIAEEGIQKRIVWMSVVDGTEPVPGDVVTLEGREVGFVTSGSYSPATGRGTAMAYVRVSRAFPGQTYAIGIGGAGHEASLSLVPLYDPTGEIRRR
jgi:aminomethyltransferase